MPPKEKIEAALADELGAIGEYGEMAAETTDPTLRALILAIAGDEYGHARSFATMLALNG